jgi:hypothetical protein
VVVDVCFFSTSRGRVAGYSPMVDTVSCSSMRCGGRRVQKKARVQSHHTLACRGLRYVRGHVSLNVYVVCTRRSCAVRHTCR